MWIRGVGVVPEPLREAQTRDLSATSHATRRSQLPHLSRVPIRVEHSTGCRCPIPIHLFSVPGFPPHPRGPRIGSSARLSWECTAPAVGSAKPVATQWGMGHVRAPLPPPLWATLEWGKFHIIMAAGDFSISDGLAFQPCPGTLAMVLGCTCTEAGPRHSFPRAAGFGSRGPDPIPASARTYTTLSP